MVLEGVRGKGHVCVTGMGTDMEREMGNASQKER